MFEVVGAHMSLPYMLGPGAIRRTYEGKNACRVSELYGLDRRRTVLNLAACVVSQLVAYSGVQGVKSYLDIAGADMNRNDETFTRDN